MRTYCVSRLVLNRDDRLVKVPLADDGGRRQFEVEYKNMTLGEVHSSLRKLFNISSEQKSYLYNYCYHLLKYDRYENFGDYIQKHGLSTNQIVLFLVTSDYSDRLTDRMKSKRNSSSSSSSRRSTYQKRSSDNDRSHDQTKQSNAIFNSILNFLNSLLNSSYSSSCELLIEETLEEIEFLQKVTELNHSVSNRHARRVLNDYKELFEQNSNDLRNRLCLDESEQQPFKFIQKILNEFRSLLSKVDRLRKHAGQINRAML